MIPLRWMNQSILAHLPWQNLLRMKRFHTLEGVLGQSTPSMLRVSLNETNESIIIENTHFYIDVHRLYQASGAEFLQFLPHIQCHIHIHCSHSPHHEASSGSVYRQAHACCLRSVEDVPNCRCFQGHVNQMDASSLAVGHGSPGHPGHLRVVPFVYSLRVKKSGRLPRSWSAGLERTPRLLLKRANSEICPIIFGRSCL